MLAQSAWRCMSIMLRYWSCPSMCTQTDAPTVIPVIQPAASHLTCVGRSRKRSWCASLPSSSGPRAQPQRWAPNGHGRSDEHQTGTAAALSLRSLQNYPQTLAPEASWQPLQGRAKVAAGPSVPWRQSWRCPGFLILTYRRVSISADDLRADQAWEAWRTAACSAIIHIYIWVCILLDT